MSRILKHLCTFTMVLWAASIPFLFTVPLVAVGPTYRDPLAPPARIAPVAEASASSISPAGGGAAHGNRFYLVMAGATPEFRVFSYDPSPGRPEIQAGREWVGRALGAMGILYGVVGAWLFRRLFAGFQSGATLAHGSARVMKWIGVWMMGYWAWGMFVQLAKSWWISSGYLSLQVDAGMGLLPGVIVYLIAWILEEAGELAEEQALTV
ncbi:MAG: DUF2975 domain-containing protein [Verrucomicrobiales bacterium]|nr:DUF2975 domain-containing protein [Verrucomicrobiales bacterium]